MNKELIKKNKEAFDYWLDGKKCLVKTQYGWRTLYYHTNWDLPDSTVVIMYDSYYELRKAVADGHKIERFNPITDRWFEYNIGVHYAFSPERKYRIKQEFSVGDYIVLKDYTKKSDIIRVTQDWLDKCSDSTESMYEKWKPISDEVCWFYDDTELPTLSHFNKMNNDLYECEDGNYAKCVPYIGEAFWEE